MPDNFLGLMWLLLLLGPLLLLQRNLHRLAQAIFLLLTRRAEIALALFSLLFFPGVFLHEFSHFIMALVLGVRTGRFSLLPRPMPDGRLQLGFVETSATDWVRDALIGAAPLLVGGAFVAYAGLFHLELSSLWEQILSGGLPALPQSVQTLLEKQDFWLWFYLIFAVSSTMLPSPSDRRAWLPLGLILVSLLLLSLFAGGGPWLLTHLAAPMDKALRAVAIVFAISVAAHLILVLPLWGVERLLERFTGLQVT